MKKLITCAVLAVIAVAATAATASAEVVVRTGEHGFRHHQRHAVVIRERSWHRHHDRGLHRGWSHSRHGGVRAKVVIR